MSELHERGGVSRPVPVALHEGHVTLLAWQERIEPPAVTYRCGRGTRRCERIGYIFETEHELGAVVVYHHSSTAQPINVPDQIANDPRFAADLAKRNKYVPGNDRALTKGRKDTTGTVLAVEDYGHAGAITMGCNHHVGTHEVIVAEQRADLARARKKGAPVEVRLPR